MLGKIFLPGPLGGTLSDDEGISTVQCQWDMFYFGLTTWPASSGSPFKSICLADSGAYSKRPRDDLSLGQSKMFAWGPSAETNKLLQIDASTPGL